MVEVEVLSTCLVDKALFQMSLVVDNIPEEVLIQIALLVPNHLLRKLPDDGGGVEPNGPGVDSRRICRCLRVFELPHYRRFRIWDNWGV